MTRRHWHVAEWVAGQRKIATLSVSDEGQHGGLIERNGAFAYPLDVPGDPRRWVCHWACTDADVR